MSHAPAFRAPTPRVVPTHSSTRERLTARQPARPMPLTHAPPPQPADHWLPHSRSTRQGA
eukprot:scaffold14160_cov74-Isochrysis_galbana.AAC.2